mgnify:FL=1
MTTRNKLIGTAAGVAVVGILSYLSFKLLKELQDLDVDFQGENMDDDYNYRTWDNNGGE